MKFPAYYKYIRISCVREDGNYFVKCSQEIKDAGNTVKNIPVVLLALIYMKQIYLGKQKRLIKICSACSRQLELEYSSTWNNKHFIEQKTNCRKTGKSIQISSLLMGFISRPYPLCLASSPAACMWCSLLPAVPPRPPEEWLFHVTTPKPVSTAH